MRILIAEDDFTSRNVLAGVLKKEGHEVTATTNGAEAWQALQASDAPALVILDWMMPEMEGLDVVRLVRARQAARPPYIIMLTTKGEKTDIITALEAGANDYLTKPCDPGELRARVEVGRRMVEMQDQLAVQVRKLSESEENYRHLMQHLHVGVVVHGPDTSVLLANQEASRVLGMSLEQMRGKVAIDPAWNLVREDGSRLPLEEYPVTRVLSAYRPVTDFIMGVDRPPKEDRVWALVNAFPKFDDRRQLRQIVVSFVDITDRKRSEDALREADARLRLFVNASKIGMWDWNLGTDEVYFSREWKGQLGYSEDEFPNLLEEWHSRIHPDDLAQAQAQLQHFRGGSAEHYVNDYRMRHKDGSYRWIVAQGQSLLDETGTAVRVMGCHMDITERKQAEQSLLTSEVRLRTLVQTIPDLVWLKDKDGVYLSCNPVFERFFGAREADIIGKTDHDFVDRGLADLFRENDCRAMAAGKPTSNEEWITFADDGHRALLETVKTPMYDNSGTLIGVLGIGRDITERKQAEDALRQSEEQVRTKLNAILLPEGDIGALELADIIDVQAIQGLMDDFFAMENLVTAIVDIHGRILVATGWQDICTRFHRVHPETSKNCLESDTLLSAGIEPGNFKLYKCKNNLWDLATPIIVGDRHLGNLFSGQFLLEDEMPDYGVFRDQARRYGFNEEEYLAALERVPRWNRERINQVMTFFARFAQLISGLSYANIKLARALTEREKLQTQLLQAQKMESVGRLAGGVAHDFNNMLSVILGHAELALMKLEPTQPLVPHLLEIHGAAERSADLTRQLLAFARKQTIAPRVLDLNESVEGMLRMLQRLIGEDLDLAWLPGTGVWPVKMDPSQLDQVMANLCVNARDAISGEGKITLETANADFDERYCATHRGFIPGTFVLLAISDDGCGMDEETLENIFEPFFTTKETGKGTGLGLATVYGIVKQNNGFINVYSEPGHGTTFRIYLPRHADEDRELKESVREPAAGGHETILLVEDQPEILALARAMLESFGYSVLAASTPDKALQLAEEHSGEISLLLTDVVMPKMNGRELAQRLQARYPGLICMFMSGYTSDVIAHRGVLEEGVHFIQKPFSMQVLAAKVREVLDKE